MATDAYVRWVNAGRPWRKARPIADIERWARARGIRVLGTIGNLAHLRASRPEDHTPFSATAWPIPLPDYVVTAIDLDPPAATGDAILASARNGAYPWLKYMNWRGRNYSYADGFKRGASNPDQHIHMSIFSDETYTSVNFDQNGGTDVPIDKKDVATLANTDKVFDAPKTWIKIKPDEDPHWTLNTYFRSIRDNVIYSREAIEAELKIMRAEAEAQRGAMLAMLQEVVKLAGGKITRSALTKAAEDGARSALADVEFSWSAPDAESAD